MGRAVGTNFVGVGGEKSLPRRDIKIGSLEMENNTQAKLSVAVSLFVLLFNSLSPFMPRKLTNPPYMSRDVVGYTYIDRGGMSHSSIQLLFSRKSLMVK